MKGWPLLATMWLGCAQEADQGVQVGEETITSPGTECSNHEASVALDDPVFPTGESARDLLAALPLTGTATPTWNDGGDASIEVDLAWDGGALVYRTSEGEDCPDPLVEVGVTGTVRSSDGLVDEVVSATLRLTPGSGAGVDDYVPADEIGGSIDPRALLDPQVDGDFTAGLEILVHLTPGSAVHGALVALGCAGRDTTGSGTTTGSGPCSPVEHDVAIW